MLQNERQKKYSSKRDVDIRFGRDWEKEESGKILESRGRVQGNI